MNNSETTRLDPTILNGPEGQNTIPPTPLQPGMPVPPPIPAPDAFSTSSFDTTPMGDATMGYDTDGYPTTDPMAMPPVDEEAKKRKRNAAAAIAAGVGGVGLGAGAVLLSSFGKDEDTDKQQNGDTAEQANLADQTTDGDIPVAHNVTEDMSFGEAFAAARAEVGPGGAFTWHGQVYSTYTAAEWNAMSPQERAEFNDHFTFFQGDGGHSPATSHNNHVADNSTHHNNSDHNNDNPGGNTPGGDNPGGNPGGGDHPGNVTYPYTVHVNDVPIEVLSIDKVEGHTEAQVRINGTEGVLIDDDNDGVFDVIGADMNADGQLNNNEFDSLHEGNVHIEVAQLMPPQQGQQNPTMAQQQTDDDVVVAQEVVPEEEGNGDGDDVVVADPDDSTMPPLEGEPAVADDSKGEEVVVDVETEDVTVVDPDDSTMPPVEGDIAEADYDVTMDEPAADMSGDDGTVDNAADMDVM